MSLQHASMYVSSKISKCKLGNAHQQKCSYDPTNHWHPLIHWHLEQFVVFTEFVQPFDANVVFSHFCTWHFHNSTFTAESVGGRCFFRFDWDHRSYVPSPWLVSPREFSEDLQECSMFFLPNMGENHGFPVNSPTSSLLSKSHAGWQRKGVDGQTVASHAGWDTTCQVQHLRNTGISPINNVYIGGVSHFVNGLYPQVYIYIPTYMWDYRGYMWIINDPKWDAHPSSSVVVEYSCWLVISTFYISFLSLLWCFNSLSWPNCGISDKYSNHPRCENVFGSILTFTFHCRCGSNPSYAPNSQWLAKYPCLMVKCLFPVTKSSTLWLFNVANWRITIFLIGEPSKNICKWAIFHGYVK